MSMLISSESVYPQNDYEEKIARLCKEKFDLVMAAADLRRDIERLKTERDVAIKERDDARVEAAIMRDAVEGEPWVVVRILKERDEARAALDQVNDDDRRSVAQWVALIKERDAARAELDRLRSGAELMRSRAMTRPAEKPVPTDSERLRSLLMRAHNAICDGFLGGEWAIYVHQQDDITMAAAKEADEAEETLDAIRQELALPKNTIDGEKRWQHIAARHAAAREG